jgi:hypothetical protein
MSAIIAVLRALIGLFVDDGSLALSILAVVALCALLALGFADMEIVVGAVLFLGCLGVLAINVARATREP